MGDQSKGRSMVLWLVGLLAVIGVLVMTVKLAETPEQKLERHTNVLLSSNASLEDRANAIAQIDKILKDPTIPEEKKQEVLKKVAEAKFRMTVEKAAKAVNEGLNAISKKLGW